MTDDLRQRAEQLTAEWLAFGSPEAADDAIQSLVPDLLARLTEVEGQLAAVTAEKEQLQEQLQEAASHVRALFPMDSEMPTAGHESSFIVHITNHLSDSHSAAKTALAQMTAQRDRLKVMANQNATVAVTIIEQLNATLTTLARVEKEMLRPLYLELENEGTTLSMAQAARVRSVCSTLAALREKE